MSSTYKLQVDPSQFLKGILLESEDNVKDNYWNPNKNKIRHDRDYRDTGFWNGAFVIDDDFSDQEILKL